MASGIRAPSSFRGAFVYFLCRCEEGQGSLSRAVHALDNPHSVATVVLRLREVVDVGALGVTFAFWDGPRCLPQVSPGPSSHHWHCRRTAFPSKDCLRATSQGLLGRIWKVSSLKEPGGENVVEVWCVRVERAFLESSDIVRSVPLDDWVSHELLNGSDRNQWQRSRVSTLSWAHSVPLTKERRFGRHTTFGTRLPAKS